MPFFGMSRSPTKRHANGVVERLAALVPETAAQDVRAEHPTLGPQERLEQVELARRELHRAPGSADRAPAGVELEVAAFEHGRRRAGTPSGERSQPGAELGEHDRLDQVVVRAEVEAVDQLVRRVGRGQHEDARLGAAGDEAPADLVAVQNR